MGYKTTVAVMRSALPADLKLLAMIVGVLVRDQATGDRPAMTLFAQVNRLATLVGIHPHSVRRQLRKLEALGYLEAVERGGGRRRMGKQLVGMATVYRVRPERLPQHVLPNVGVGDTAHTPTSALVKGPDTPTSALGPYREVEDLNRNSPRTSVCKTTTTLSTASRESSSLSAPLVETATPCFDDRTTFGGTTHPLSVEEFL
jgi:hypothetical protein